MHLLFSCEKNAKPTAAPLLSQPVIELHLRVEFKNYDREYFINNDSKVRLTIDKNQNYFQIAPSIKHYATDDSIVVELKYNLDKDYKNFVIRTNLAQNSKYRNGIDLLFGI